ncbi:hypothetical protein ADS77_09220 [Pseudoalteromonas porphyrae]|uniref:Oxidoreductase-like domain-containing protein n=2 Tax=Pseudoalteromonas TaxID=53246 RepID=A0A0N1EMC8_9GAMM|nr:hypothetical protein ADS77_09220 [Pseudoalteromonas porphyrae]
MKKEVFAIKNGLIRYNSFFLNLQYQLVNIMQQTKAAPKPQSEQPKPQKPAPDECCGGGSCCPCVWDEYRDKLKQWQQNFS